MQKPSPTSNAVVILRGLSLNSLTALLAPVGATEIKPLLAKLSLACRSNQGDDLDWRARAALYVEYLSDLPAQFLSEAIDEWIRTSVFFPAISELRTMTNRKAETARKRREELEYAERRRAEEARDAKIDRPTPEQMESIRAEIEARWGSNVTPITRRA